jgi:hypothetical protein
VGFFVAVFLAKLSVVVPAGYWQSSLFCVCCCSLKNEIGA